VIGVDARNVSRFGNGFEEGTVVRWTDKYLNGGTNCEFAGVYESRDYSTDSGNVEDVFY